MNELTKKEIQDIEVVYRAFCSDGRVLTNFEQSIMKKLKSMADTYCDHYWTIGAPDCICCSKCQKEIFFND